MKRSNYERLKIGIQRDSGYWRSLQTIVGSTNKNTIILYIDNKRVYWNDLVRN